MDDARVDIDKTIAIHVGVVGGSEVSVGTKTGDILIVGNDPYIGDYTIVPDMDDHKLECKDKKMLDDVNVTAIPVYKAQNLSGGDTVTIGGLFNYG